MRLVERSPLRSVRDGCRTTALARHRVHGCIVAAGDSSPAMTTGGNTRTWSLFAPHSRSTPRPQDSTRPRPSATTASTPSDEHRRREGSASPRGAENPVAAASGPSRITITSPSPQEHRARLRRRDRTDPRARGRIGNLPGRSRPPRRNSSTTLQADRQLHGCGGSRSPSIVGSPYSRTCTSGVLYGVRGTVPGGSRVTAARI